MAERFESVDKVIARLREADYLADAGIAGVVFLADRLEKPVLVEGPAGVGKTELAKAIAQVTGSRLIRLQCYEGLDEAKALYEWNYKKQLLRIQSDREHEASWAEVEADIFSEPFLLTRPLLEAIRSEEPVVLLIDEVDRVEIETEALLLEVLSDFQVSIPELGTIVGNQLAADRAAHVEQHPGAVGGVEAAVPLPAHRLPEHRAREGDRAGAGARDRRRARGSDRAGRPVDPSARAEEVAVDLGDHRLGTHAPLPRQVRDRPRRDRRDAARAAEVPVRHHQGAQGASGPRRRHPVTSSTRDGAVSMPMVPAAAPTEVQSLLDVLQGFVHELRAAGLPVSMTENLDAMRALEYVDISDREVFRTVLATTLVKHHRHQRAFDVVFNVYFSLFSHGIDDDELLEASGPRQRARRRTACRRAGAGTPMSREELAEMLMRALMNMDREALRRLARARGAAVRRHGARPARRRHLLPVPHAAGARPRGAHRAAHGQARQQGEAGEGELADRLLREEFEARLRELRELVEEEIRRALVADRGMEAMARTLRKPLPEDVEFMHASRDEMLALQRAVYPLTRSMAARLAQRRRRRHRGALDFRKTVRASLSYGGVPAEPKFRHPHPSKPEIMVIADISGSVASFARFTLMFVYAMASQFSKVRSWVFIDGIDEVTTFFQESDDVTDAVHRVNVEADVVWVDGHSDYGHAFETFYQRHYGEITPKSSIILLGDARNNYHASEAWVVERDAEARPAHLLAEPRAAELLGHR